MILTNISTIVTLVLSSITIHAAPTIYSDCLDVDAYYSVVDDLSDRPSVHQLLVSRHRGVLPYTSSDTDTWDALIDLDNEGDEGAGSASNATLFAAQNLTIQPIYAAPGAVLPAEPYGDSSNWNREHSWPQSRGATGAAKTDLHALFPCRSPVNSARQNKYYGECGSGDDAGGGSCTKRPGHELAADDTAYNELTWTPPVQVRGNLARAIFYMDLRYDGDDDETPDLVVNDCPPVKDGRTMGYLSTLLEWHVADPVDDAERRRNVEVCSKYQGVRNIFVDRPDLVQGYFGEVPSNQNCTYEEPEEPEQPIPSKVPEQPVPTPSSSSPPEGPCEMQPGDLALVAADYVISQDYFALVALVDIPPGTTLYVTDNAWTGSNFKSNEGTLKMTVTKEGISSGTVIQYPDDSLWQRESGSFALSQKGDTILLYCKSQSNDMVPLYGFSSAVGGWATPSDDESAFSTQTSALPSKLTKLYSVELNHMDVYQYDGITEGSRLDLLRSISNTSNWKGGDESSYLDTDKTNIQYQVLELESSAGEPFKKPDSSVNSNSSSNLSLKVSRGVSIIVTIFSMFFFPFQ